MAYVLVCSAQKQINAGDNPATFEVHPDAEVVELHLGHLNGGSTTGHRAWKILNVGDEVLWAAQQVSAKATPDPIRMHRSLVEGRFKVDCSATDDALRINIALQNVGVVTFSATGASKFSYLGKRFDTVGSTPNIPTFAAEAVRWRATAKELIGFAFDSTYFYDPATATLRTASTTVGGGGGSSGIAKGDIADVLDLAFQSAGKGRVNKVVDATLGVTGFVSAPTEVARLWVDSANSILWAARDDGITVYSLPAMGVIKTFTYTHAGATKPVTKIVFDGTYAYLNDRFGAIYRYDALTGLNETLISTNKSAIVMLNGVMYAYDSAGARLNSIAFDGTEGANFASLPAGAPTLLIGYDTENTIWWVADSKLYEINATTQVLTGTDTAAQISSALDACMSTDSASF